MVGGTTFRRTVIHGEIPESWSFNLSGKPHRCFAPHRKTMPLTTPSLLSHLEWCIQFTKQKWATRPDTPTGAGWVTTRLPEIEPIAPCTSIPP